jgi:type VI secretion system protein VasD
MGCSSRRRCLLALLALVASATLTGCTSVPKPPPPPPLPAPRPPPPPPALPPTVLRAVIQALASVNPDVNNRPSPVTVRVYVLKRHAVFDSADFFALYDKDREALSAELVDREEFQLMPGASRLIEKPVAPEGAYIGVFAAFRDLERAQWRAVNAIIPRQANTFEIRLEQSNVTIIRQN